MSNYGNTLIMKKWEDYIEAKKNLSFKPFLTPVLKRLLSYLKLHFHAILWSQRNCRIQLNALIFGQIHSPFLSYGCNYEYTFHPCKRLSNAASYSTSKWKVAKSRQMSFEFICPPSRIEF